MIACSLQEKVNLRLTGLPEKDDENVREMGHRDPDPDYPCVSGEAARHRGYRATGSERERVPTPSNNVSRVVIIQFGMRMIRDEDLEKI